MAAERVDPTRAQRRRLLTANASRCCVCKRRGIGVDLHHVDGDRSNTVDANLAVLCVEDHDRHHRPRAYTRRLNHLELGESQILRSKESWEAFVAEARKPAPGVLATLSSYGTEELIHSLQLVMQWPDERIEYARSFHLLDGDLDRLTDEVIAELASIGPNVKLAMIDQPLPVEYCPCCGTGVSRTLTRGIAVRLTDPAWAAESVCSVYLNPSRPSLAVQISLRGVIVFSATLHLCRGKFLHLSADAFNERVPLRERSSVPTQACGILERILEQWSPAALFIGTGNADRPEVIDRLVLPPVWERATRTGRRRSCTRRC